MNTVKDIIKEIDESRKSKTSSCMKDEVKVMEAMLNDNSFIVDIYSKTGVVGQYCPAEDAHNMISNIIKNTTKISAKEAEELSKDYVFTKQDAATFVNLSKEFINTYMETGRKLPLGGRKDSNISIAKKVKEERTSNFPVKIKNNEDGINSYETINKTIPSHGSLKVYSPCPSWIK